MSEKILAFLKEIGPAGLIDIILMSVLLYAVLSWFKKKRAALVLVGILTLGLVYLIAYQFRLQLTATLLQAFFAVLIIALIVIFQEELRSFFERLGAWSIKGQQGGSPPSPTEIEILTRTLLDFSRKKIGALLVICGKDPVARHLEGGVELNGKISESILMSIFDPHSQGHDGAVVIQRDQIALFGCHLPLSKNFEENREMGTRHAAALGLTERSDVLCIVVSEEQGTLSAAQKGQIFPIQNAEHLKRVLGNFYQEILPTPHQKSGLKFFRKNPGEKIAAVCISVLLWFVVVHGAKYSVRSFKIPVEYFQLAPQLMVKEVEPDEVVATFSGPRNAFHLLGERDIRLALKLLRTEEGTEVIELSKSDFTFPKDINLENIEPNRVKVTLGPRESKEGGKDQ